VVLVASSVRHGKPRDRPDRPCTVTVRYCLQNHDQVGNRATGERLGSLVSLPAQRLAASLLLLAPHLPLLFMGQEWAATTPFLFFTDHHAKLGRQVTEGRRREFREFAAFTARRPARRSRTPALSTFQASKLAWHECEREPHASLLRLYQQLCIRAAPNRPVPPRVGPASLHSNETPSFCNGRLPEADVLVVVQLRGEVSIFRGIPC
jgi:maltooligosyltrehalose trehalohydrolase